MNFNKELFDAVESKEFGETFESIELGGHILVIKEAVEYVSQTKVNSFPSLKVSVDTDKSDKQPEFFAKQYRENTAIDKKWSNSAIRYLSLKDENLAYLKGFITSLEKSNPGFKFDKNGTWEQFKNLKIAGVFGLEEFQREDGTIGTSIKLINFRSVDKLNEIEIPKVKTIDGTYVDYEEYLKFYTNRRQENSTPEVTADMLPF